MSETMENSIAVFWFRRDLRLEDNVALHAALESGLPVLPIFIFDDDILDELPADDPRVNFIYDELKVINDRLSQMDSSLKIMRGKPLEVWREMIKTQQIEKVFCNEDYEPYALNRDRSISELLKQNHIEFQQYQDHVIFKPGDIVKDDGKPYTVYTPFKNKWLSMYKGLGAELKMNFDNFLHIKNAFPNKQNLKIKESAIKVKPFQLSVVPDYDKARDTPSLDATSYLGPHLRFGTVSIRDIVRQTESVNATFISELIWREFFIHILYHFPLVVENNFKAKYDAVPWRNKVEEFEKWKKGETGFPLVDAGMKQLNKTGYMHNRVRMITAGFLCKHLLIDWRWGEAYFAEKLLDYEMASNNGNWQWSAGTGCDAAPYFRVFNPTTQIEKFDKQQKYISTWLGEDNNWQLIPPMVDHSSARTRAIETYKKALASS